MFLISKKKMNLWKSIVFLNCKSLEVPFEYDLIYYTRTATLINSVHVSN